MNYRTAINIVPRMLVHIYILIVFLGILIDFYFNYSTSKLPCLYNYAIKIEHVLQVILFNEIQLISVHHHAVGDRLIGAFD